MAPKMGILIVQHNEAVNLAQYDHFDSSAGLVQSLSHAQVGRLWQRRLWRCTLL